MTNELKTIIEQGDVAHLKSTLESSPELGRAPITFGPQNQHSVPPLHYVCDVLFRKLVNQEQALSMGDALIDSGVDIHEVYARSGDTFLIAAASLGAESLGVRLVELGADVHARGLFGATALHWSALMGQPKLANALLRAGAPTDVTDRNYGATPLGWAQHAFREGNMGPAEGLRAVAALLGGSVEA
ncbi:Ankyrin repeats (3 copies) [Planctomycetes bacterium Poly30]|uniref:Ankyrin repeats (3 copies) n=1 Tax=Saltatorellus ferox TaxID=2528018 RepID=A0A518EYI5_9BACT|nr:Ankyrin repeats (3 copies) [Planctomycetes bacterium Poly30]